MLAEYPVVLWHMQNMLIHGICIGDCCCNTYVAVKQCTPFECYASVI